MPQTIVQTIPLLRVLLPYLGGVVIALLLPASEVWSFIGFGIVWLSLLAIANRLADKRYQLGWLPGVVLAMGFVLLGFFRVNQVEDHDHPAHFGRKADTGAKVLIKATQPPKPAGKTVRLKGEALAVWQDSSWQETQGYLLAYLKGDSAAKKVNYGDVIVADNQFEPVSPPPNPKQFNRKAFLSNKQIYHQAFLDTSQWRETSLNKGNQFFKLIYHIRHQCLTWLSGVIHDHDAYAVAAALLAGYKAEIDPDLRSSYASTGAMHVLAVSGLHVGIIYLMLSYGLSFLNLLPKGRYAKLMVIVLLLWVYACVTGLPSSVIRACTMFSFVAIGSNLRRTTNIYGSITASLILLLLINPFLLTQVGFQLSYAAVIGIVFLQPRLYHLFPQSRSWLLDKVWAITAVSLAAQISTFPLTLFYFNQFPTYFMISNLVVIPAAMLIVPTGFAFFLMKAIDASFLSSATGSILDGLLRSLNFLIAQVEALPYALIDQLYINTTAFYLIYVVIIGLSVGIVFRYKSLLFAGLTASAAVLGLMNYQLWQQQDQAKLAYLKIDNATVLAGLGAQKAVFQGPKGVLEKANQVKFFTYRFLWSNGLKKGAIRKKPVPAPERSKSLSNGYAYDTLAPENLAVVNNKTVLLATEPLYWPDTTSCHLEVDHVLLTHGKALEPKHAKRYLDPELVILGFELPPWTIDEWEKTCHHAPFACYNLREKGALVKNL